MINKYRDHLVGQLTRVLWTPFLYLRLQGVVQIRKGETQWRSEWTSQQNKCKDEEVKSRSAFLKEKVGQAAVTGAKNGDLTHDVERTWKRYFQDNKTTQDRRYLPGRGECKGNMGLGNRQGSEEADEGLPVHPRARPSRLHSLHCCALPQLAVAIFRFT